MRSRTSSGIGATTSSRVSRARSRQLTLRVESTPIADLPDLIDELADLAGESFVSITALSGATYKMEILLSGFYRRHLAKKLGGGHLPLLAGFEPPAGPDPHAVVSLDWWYPPLQLPASARPAEDHARLVATRQAAEAAAIAALAGSPKRLRRSRACWRRRSGSCQSARSRPAS